MRIVISEFMDDPAVARLQATHDVLYDPKLVDQASRLANEATTADALIVRNRTQVRGDLLDALTRCQVVGRLGVGLDNIDVAACEARNIRVIPATGANALAVAEYVIAAAMLLLRGAYGSTSQVASGVWPRDALGRGRELGGKTLGLVGFGGIGRVAAKFARALGMQVVAYDALLDDDDAAYANAGVRRASLDALLAQSDVVSLHIPLVDATRKLFDAARIAAMKPGAVLINTSRGGIVDEAALVAALKSGRLGGAALDVFEVEPLPASSFPPSSASSSPSSSATSSASSSAPSSTSPDFENCPNLVLTPHIAGVTAEANARVSTLIADKVLEALQ